MYKIKGKILVIKTGNASSLSPFGSFSNRYAKLAHLSDVSLGLFFILISSEEK